MSCIVRNNVFDFSGSVNGDMQTVWLELQKATTWQCYRVTMAKT